MPAEYQLTSGGVRRASDGAYIPNQGGNRDWQMYQAWLSAGNTPDPLPPVTLETYKARAVASIEGQFVARAREVVEYAQARGFSDQLLVRELDRVEGDGSPSAAEYPMLAAMVPAEGADVVAVANVLRPELLASSQALAPLEAVRRAGVAAVNAASDASGVDTALGAVAWP